LTAKKFVLRRFEEIDEKGGGAVKPYPPLF
jgi:hypothetical protein